MIELHILASAAWWENEEVRARETALVISRWVAISVSISVGKSVYDISGLDMGIIMDIEDMKAHIEMKGYLCPSGSLCDPTPDRPVKGNAPDRPLPIKDIQEISG